MKFSNMEVNAIECAICPSRVNLNEVTRWQYNELIETLILCDDCCAKEAQVLANVGEVFFDNNTK